MSEQLVTTKVSTLSIHYDEHENVNALDVGVRIPIEFAADLTLSSTVTLSFDRRSHTKVLSSGFDAPDVAARRAAAEAEIRANGPDLHRQLMQLYAAGFRPTAALLPSRLNVPYTGPNATDVPASLFGLPVTWADGEEWGFVMHARTSPQTGIEQ